MTEVTPTTPPRERNPRGQGDRLRDELVAAAVDLLSTVPHPDEVSVRGVARRAGVSPTATYRHFADRDELVTAACAACFDEFARDMAEAIAREDDPFARLRAAGDAYAAYAMAEHGHYRVLFSNPVPLDHEAIDESSAGKVAFDQLVEVVQECLDAGAPTRTDDAVFLSFQVWTWMHGIVDLRITHPTMDWPPLEPLLDDLSVALGLVPPDADG